MLPFVSTKTMNLHLAEISRTITPDAHCVLTLDGAGWHQTGGNLVLLDNISLLSLPPDSPELDPVENIWQFRRQKCLADRVLETYDAIVTACCDAWNALTKAPSTARSISTREWAAAFNARAAGMTRPAKAERDGDPV